MIVTSASAPMRSVPLSMPRTRAGLIVILARAVRPVEMARLDQPRDDQAQGGFQADDAERGLVELAHFLFRRVRGVVGADHVDRAVDQAGDAGLDVPLAAQRRAHLVVRVEFPQATRR